MAAGSGAEAGGGVSAGGGCEHDYGLQVMERGRWVRGEAAVEAEEVETAVVDEVKRCGWWLRVHVDVDGWLGDGC